MPFISFRRKNSVSLSNEEQKLKATCPSTPINSWTPQSSASSSNTSLVSALPKTPVFSPLQTASPSSLSAASVIADKHDFFDGKNTASNLVKSLMRYGSKRLNQNQFNRNNKYFENSLNALSAEFCLKPQHDLQYDTEGQKTTHHDLQSHEAHSALAEESKNTIGQPLLNEVDYERYFTKSLDKANSFWQNDASDDDSLYTSDSNHLNLTKSEIIPSTNLADIQPLTKSTFSLGNDDFRAMRDNRRNQLNFQPAPPPRRRRNYSTSCSPKMVILDPQVWKTLSLSAKVRDDDESTKQRSTKHSTKATRMETAEHHPKSPLIHSVFSAELNQAIEHETDEELTDEQTPELINLPFPKPPERSGSASTDSSSRLAQYFE